MKWFVDVVKGPHAGLRIEMQGLILKIGRESENHLLLNLDAKISRYHAEIFLQEDKIFLKNISQKNFVTVNGEKIEVSELKNQDIFQIGDSECRWSSGIAQQLVKKTSVASNVPSNIPSSVGAVTPPPLGMSSNPTSISAQQPLFQSTAISTQSDGKLRFYLIVGGIASLFIYLLLPPQNKTSRDPNAVKTSLQVQEDLQQTDINIQQLRDQQEKLNSPRYQRVQENFKKGFRDYNQGQYGRAREFFQVVLNLDPEHELARRYHHLSKIKFDEQVKRMMFQGSSYREKKNWRLCQSHFSQVLILLQNQRNDPTYLAAKKFYEECSLGLEGRL